MGELVKATQIALTGEESINRNIQQRNLISDSLRYLNQHEAALVKSYPMALLEIFAEGPAASKGRESAHTGMDFGELSLLDESEVQAQVELSKALQSALHATDAVLAELNTLVSAAQGLRSVQPERNPLRPESYIRALQHVVSETGVPPEVRPLWMQHMRDLLGKLLVEEYKKTVSSLREHGVQPVGYAVLGNPAGASTGRRDGHGSNYGGPGYNGGYGGPGGSGTAFGGGSYSGYGPSMNGPMGDYGHTGYERSGRGQGSGWNGDSLPGAIAPAAEEALLTAGILRQMLVGGDPFDPRTYGVTPTSAMSAPYGARPGAEHPGPDQRAGTYSAQSGLGGEYFPGGNAAEAIEDMVQLERLVGRLASGGAASQPRSFSAPLSGRHGFSSMAPVVYATMPMEAAAQSTAMAMEVVGRMMFNIAQDRRLLPPVQKAVQGLEPALKQLVQYDGRFFTDGSHPARRLLDELTQRSLAFTGETAPGFSSFMRLITGAVDHLTVNEIKDAGPFDTVLKALQSAWDTQEQKRRAHQEAQQKLLVQAEQREVLSQKIAAEIRKLPDVDQVPTDILDFAAGPWADVVALAQVMNAPNAPNDDPGGFLALVPVLLWSSQPDLTHQETDRLNDAVPGLLAKLRKGLKTINYPATQTSALLQRLVGLHQAAFEDPVAAPAVAAVEPEPGPAQEVVTGFVTSGPSAHPVDSVCDDDAPATARVAVPDPYANFVIGAWVELLTGGRVVRTQLTWASPHGTLFLFTAPDASTQSMTRRMRDKLAAQGALRVVPLVNSVAARALDGTTAAPGRASQDSKAPGSEPSSSKPPRP